MSLSLFMLFGGCGREPADTTDALSDLFPIHPSPEAVTSQDDWTAAISPRAFAFPADHGAHEDYRIEWWYYTGNLEAEDGSRFGYQLTFFRTGLNKETNNPSKWAVRDLYTAHFAISDLGSRQHYCFQRNSRRGTGQAGAEVGHYAVWNGDWKAWMDGENHRLQAGESETRIDLTLSPKKSLVLHGDNGLSQKGSMVGNASHYYSFTRLLTEGTIRIDGVDFRIQGSSWMDHEFSTSFLEPGQLGWDWFSIQLDNGIDLMLYRMRRKDGTTDPFSSGSVVRKDGQLTHLSATEFRLTPLRNWTSSATGAAYPLDWNVEIPGLGYQLAVTSAFDRQEMTTNDTTGINYWEGAIEITGNSEEGRVTGRGYMELTGYAGQGLGALFD